MSANRSNMAWLAHRASHEIEPVMRFTDEGLVLGAGTILAPSAGSSRDISIDPSDPRLRALLTAAHIGEPRALALSHLQKAAERWREGDDALAAMHLTLSRLDRLAQPEADALRLFVAAALLDAEAVPTAIARSVSDGHAESGYLSKFDPNEPRVPAGSGRPSGQ